MGLRVEHGPGTAPYFTVGATYVTMLPPTGKYWRFGDAAATSHALASNDDVLITGKLEVDGHAFFDEAVYVADNKYMYFGVVDAALAWSTDQTKHSFALGVGNTSKMLVISDRPDMDNNWGHADKTNPTVIIQSAGTTAANHLRFSHDATDGYIITGAGDLQLLPNSGVIRFGTYTAGAATDSTGYITVKDAAGNTRKLMVQA